MGISEVTMRAQATAVLSLGIIFMMSLPTVAQPDDIDLGDDEVVEESTETPPKDDATNTPEPKTTSPTPTRKAPQKGITETSSRSAPEIILGDNLHGLRGLVRLTSAALHPPGWFAVGTTFQGFTTSDLTGANTSHSRLRTTFSMAWAPIQWLSVALAMHVTADDSSTNTDNPNQQRDALQVSVGDYELLLKGGGQLAKGFHLGGLLGWQIPSGAGFFSSGVSASRITLGLLASWQPMSTLPLQVHANFGVLIDNSTNLFSEDDSNGDPVDADKPQLSKLTPAQVFSAELSSKHRILARVGVSYETRYVAPFVEVSFEPFIGAPSAPTNAATGESFFDVPFGPSYLTVGIQGWIGRSRTLQLMAGVDIGLLGVGNNKTQTTIPTETGSDTNGNGQIDPNESVVVNEYLFPISRWNLIFRASYRFDPFAPPELIAVPTKDHCPVCEPKPSEKDRFSYIHGLVIDSQTGQPLDSARVKVLGSDVSAVAVVPTTGEFRSQDVKVGTHRIKVSCPEYTSQEVPVTVTPQPTKLTVNMVKAASQEKGTLRGVVKRRGNGRPLSKATVLIPQLNRTIKVDSDGSFEARLPPGKYQIVISAPRYRPQTKYPRIRSNEATIMNIDLYR